MTNTPPKPRVIKVTQAQQDRIDRAWEICAYPSDRKITNPNRLGWFDWAVLQVTGIDVRGESFTFEVTP
jgi:hypothetical protein